MNIINSSILMKTHPSETSTLETECLFGENVEILDESLEWLYCKLDTDNYCGWIKKKSLGKSIKTTHRVLVKRTFIYVDKSPKSNSFLYLPMGAKLFVENINYDWAQVNFFKNDEVQIGYVPSKHIVNLNHVVKDWVAKAEQLNGTPYRWGGRDTIGIDCSALLQLSYQTYGKNIPRNSSQQLKLKNKKIEHIDNLKRGCVIFWKGHVAIMIDRLNCIHANAFHMQTKIESLSEIIDRFDDNIIKMMDFN